MVLASREFIAVPDDRKQQIVFKWPDVRVRKHSRAIVDADEVALFINTGQVIGTMGPGRHQIDADELPFLGTFIDIVTGGNAYRAELYFVGTREYAGFTFGGRIDDVQDPQTGLIVTLRVFGDYSLQVRDPTALVTNLAGTVDVTDNDLVAGWVSDQLLKVMRTEVTTQVVRNGWAILGLSVHTPELEQAVLAAANAQLATYGVSLVRMGNFDINLPEQDEAQLKSLAKDTAYSRLAGGFSRYAAGEMAIEAGQGMAAGGSGDIGVMLATGLGLGGQATAGGSGQGQSGAPGPVPPPAPGFAGGGLGFAAGAAGAAPAPATAVTCPHCQATVPPGSKFCPSCGKEMPAASRHCPSCGADNAPGAHFCASCGTPLTEEAAHCASCGADLVPGQRFCASCGTATTPAVGETAAPTPAVSEAAAPTPAVSEAAAPTARHPGPEA